MQYSKVTEEFKEEFFKLIENSQNILISSHKKPDDDSIGCVLSTYYGLTEKYPQKNFQIMYSKDIDTRWNYFENFDKIKVVADITNVTNKFDLIVFLDSSQFHLFSEFPENLAGYKGKTICLDHHKNTPDKFDLLLLDSNASSATELVYYLLAKDYEKIPQSLAETLLLGILGDTGYLEFIQPSQAYIYSVVQKLVVDGNINVQELRARYDTYSERVFKVTQEFIKNAQIKQIKVWPKFLFSYITQEFVKSGKFTDLEISMGSHIFIQTFGKALKESTWGFSVSPKTDGTVTVGIRSKPGSVNAKDFMQQMGIGGGHDRAAGGKFVKKEGEKDLDPKECLEKIFKWMEENEPPIS